MKPNDAVLDALKKASKGLVYTSDTDAPLEPFAWKGGDKLTEDQVRQLAGAKGETVEQMSLADFFRSVPSEDKAKFDALAKTLQAQLAGVTVFKVGDDAEKAAYIVGRAADGRWAGLKTALVES
jgi:Nuclease A inhibitor-like protein